MIIKDTSNKSKKNGKSRQRQRWFQAGSEVGLLIPDNKILQNLHGIAQSKQRPTSNQEHSKLAQK